MLKWIALLIVTTVLCWGDTGNHSSSQSTQETPRKSHPVVEETDSARSLDGLNEEDRKQLEVMIQELDGVGKLPNREVGEQEPVKVTTIPDL